MVQTHLIIHATPELASFSTAGYWEHNQMSRNLLFSSYHYTKLQQSDNI